MLPRTAKGKRPAYSENPHVDSLISIVMAMAGELQVTRERLDTLERVAAAKGLFTQSDMERYVPNAEDELARHKARTEYIERILWILKAERDAFERDESWDQTVAEVSEIGKW